jgi:hypothetical protein
MSLAHQIMELRGLVEKGGENPDQYRSRVGKCPAGFHWDGSRCAKGPADSTAKAAPSPAPATSPGDQPDQAAPKAAAPKGFFAKAKAFAAKKLEQAKTDAQAIAQETKDWGSKAKNLVTNAPHATKAFFTDPPYRRASMMAAHTALTQAPGKFAKRVVDTAKHEVEEFKTAGGALRTLAKKKSWKALDDHQKKALVTVGKHLALTIGAAAGAHAGLAAGVAKGLTRSVLAKAAGNVFQKLHTAEELQHISHLFTDAAGEAEEEAAMFELSKMIETEIAHMLKAGVDPKDLEAVANHMADHTKSAPRQESYVLPAARPLNCGAQLHEWTMHEATQVRRWADVGDGVQSAYNHFAVSHGKFLKLDDPQGDITPSGVVDTGFGWEMRKNAAASESGVKGAKIGGEVGFKMREMGNSVIADVESRAWGQISFNGTDAKTQKKSFRGKSRAEVAQKLFKWLDRTVGDQGAEVANNLYDLQREGPY